MATAPRPRPAEDTPTSFLRMRVRDVTLEMPSPAVLPLKERFAVRAATGLPLEAFFAGGESSIGYDSLPVLWWLARRHNGEPALSLKTVEGEFPPPDGFDPDDIDIEFVDLTESDDPES